MNLAARNAGKINSVIHVLAWLHFINTHIHKNDQSSTHESLLKTCRY